MSVSISESLRRCVGHPDTLGFYAMKYRDTTRFSSLYVMLSSNHGGYEKYKEIEYEDESGYAGTVSAHYMISLLKSGKLVRISDDVIRRGGLVK